MKLTKLKSLNFIFILIVMILLNIVSGSIISYDSNSRINNKNDKNNINVWIYFSDKGNINLNEQIHKIEQEANSDQIKRRTKVRRELFDFRDIAVYQTYINEILKNPIIKLRTTSKWLNAISVSMPPNFIEDISSIKFVSKIEEVKSGRRVDTINFKTAKIFNRNNYGPSQNQLEQINAIEAHENGYKGQGIKILVLDTGFYTDHESINENNILDEWDFINNDSETQNQDGDHNDQHNHGTYILSVIGGAKEEQLYGPAYESNFFLAKTEDLTQEQPIEEDWFVAALEWGESLGADISSS